MSQIRPPPGDPIRPGTEDKRDANSVESTEDAVSKKNPHYARFGQGAANVEQLDTRPLALRVKPAPWWRFW